MKKRVFLTGASGFIGGHVLDALVGEGHEVTLFRRGVDSTVPESGVGLASVVKPMDQLAEEDFRGHEVLVHLASPGVSPKQATGEELIYWNVLVLNRLLEKAHAAGVRRVIVAGTFAEYGRSSERLECIPPDAPLEPIDVYPSSKAAGFLVARAFAEKCGMELVYLRIFNAFGVGGNNRNIWTLLREAAGAGRDFPMSPGEQIRDFIAVESVAAHFATAVAMPISEEQKIFVANVASGHAVMLKDFCDYWWKRWQAPGRLLVGSLPYRKGECFRYVAQVSDVFAAARRVRSAFEMA